MAENKTKETKVSVEKFIDTVKDEKKRNDCFIISNMMKKITGEDPKMWGPSIVGFGKYHYKYESGREGEFFITGFSPRKSNLTLYIMSGFKKYESLLTKLGKYKNSGSCIYLKTLDDINLKILETMISDSVKYLKKKYPST